MPAKFITARAVALLELNALVDANKEAYGERFVELMENPAERDPAIAVDCIGYLVARNAEETGDEAESANFAYDLAAFAVLPFGTISEVPLPTRGVLHSTGAAMVSAICDRQTWLELVGIEALEIGTGMGLLNRGAAKRMTTPEKKKMAQDGQLKKTLNQLEAAKKDDTTKV